MTTPLYKRIKQLRESKGITQTHMTKKLGYKSVSSYNAFESGRKKRSITIEQAKIIAQELNISLDELFSAENVRETRNSDDDEEKPKAFSA